MHVVVTLSAAEEQPWMDHVSDALPGARVERGETVTDTMDVERGY